MLLNLDPISKYADFTGRASRAEYWGFYLTIVLASAALAAFTGLCYVVNAAPFGLVAMTLLVMLQAAAIIPVLAAGVRRMHDRNSSGWCMLLSAIPFVGFAIWLWFMCTPGTAGPNCFGPAPISEGKPTIVPPPADPL